MHKNEKTQNSHSFLALAFFRGICSSRHQRIWNQHKILRVFDTHIDIFQEKKCLGHNSTFCNLKMQMRKKLYIFKHFAKSKKLFLCQYLSISVWFLLKFQKKYKIEAPYCTHAPCTELCIFFLWWWTQNPKCYTPAYVIYPVKKYLDNMKLFLRWECRI